MQARFERSVCSLCGVELASEQQPAVLCMMRSRSSQSALAVIDWRAKVLKWTTSRIACGAGAHRNECSTD